MLHSPVELKNLHSEADALTLRWYGMEDRGDVMSAWRAVEDDHPAPPLMASADWTEAWLNHFGATVPHRFAIWTRERTPVAAALVTQGQVDAERLVAVASRHVGTAGEPDADSVCIEYNALMCRPGNETCVWQSLVSQLLADTDWDELRLDGFTATDLEWLVASGESWTWTRKPARYVDLAEVRHSGGELINSFGDSTRKGIRQNLRHFGPLNVEWVTSVEQAHDVFNELVALHQQRWQAEGEPGCYASAAFTAFHRELLERLAPRGRMVLFRVKSGAATLGCSQLLIDRGRVLLYQGGRQTNDAKRSPGLVIDFLAMQAALEHGYAAFDFMAGDSVHKQRLTTHTTDLVWGVLQRPRLKFALMEQLRQIKRWLKALQMNEREMP